MQSRFCLRVLGVLAVGILCTGIAVGQMSPEEALKKIQQEEANKPSTRITLDALDGLHNTIANSAKEIASLKAQITDLKSRTPGTPPSGVKIDVIESLSYVTVTDTRQAFNVQLNGNLTPAVSGQRQTVTTTTVTQGLAGPSASVGIRSSAGAVPYNVQPNQPGQSRGGNPITNQHTTTLRQLEKFSVVVNTGSNDPRTAFVTYTALVDADTHVVTKLDGPAGSVLASVAPASAAVPPAVPTTYEEDITRDNESLREQLAPMAATNDKLQGDMKAQAAQFTTQLAQANQQSTSLREQVQQLQTQLQNQPAPVAAASVVAPTPAGMSVPVNFLSASIATGVLIAVFVAAIKIAAR